MDEDKVIEPTTEVAPVETTEPAIEPTAKDRTKEQFDKLKNNNQELKKQNEHYKNVLQSLRPDVIEPAKPVTPTTPDAKDFSHLNQAQVENITQGLVDENGYVDMGKLSKILQETNERAIRAERAAQAAQSQSTKTVRDFEESSVMQQVHKDYPALDPKSDQFDEEYYDSVRNELVGQMLKTGKEDVPAAAKKWHERLFGKKEPVETKEEKQQREQGEQARALINTTPTGNVTKNRTSSNDLEYLRTQTRLGSQSALKERLERAGY